MINQIYDKKAEVRITKVYEKISCDICEKIIRRKIFDDEVHALINEIKYHDDYYTVTSGHNDWGNDSVDSISHGHICSPECLKKFVDDYIEDSHSGRRNTEYLNIKHVNAERVD